MLVFTSGCASLSPVKEREKNTSRKGKVKICVKGEDDDDDEAPPFWKSISHINDLKARFPEVDFS